MGKIKSKKNYLGNKVKEYEFIETHRELIEELNDFATDEPHLEKLRESESPYNL